MVPGEDMETWVPNALQTPVTRAPVTYEVARETGRLRLPHRDLADRFLLATAKVFELTLSLPTNICSSPAMFPCSPTVSRVAGNPYLPSQQTIAACKQNPGCNFFHLDENP
jgi:hypothetical protein